MTAEQLKQVADQINRAFSKTIDLMPLGPRKELMPPITLSAEGGTLWSVTIKSLTTSELQVSVADETGTPIEFRLSAQRSAREPWAENIPDPERGWKKIQ